MKIVYYSETGNTETMAEFIKKGMEEAGGLAELVTADNAHASEIAKEEIIIMGCPALGSEQIDDNYIEPLVDAMKDDLSGKKVALFGSYGWGTGEWMEEWEDKMKSYGANLVLESLIVNERPEGNDVQTCIDWGKKLVNH